MLPITNIELFDLKEGRHRNSLQIAEANDGYYTRGVITPDGKYVIFTSDRNELVFWSMSSGKRVATKALSTDKPWRQLRGLQISSDGKTLAVHSRALIYEGELKPRAETKMHIVDVSITPAKSAKASVVLPAGNQIEVGPCGASPWPRLDLGPNRTLDQASSGRCRSSYGMVSHRLPKRCFRRNRHVTFVQHRSVKSVAAR